jgi:hypothetical protein
MKQVMFTIAIVLWMGIVAAQDRSVPRSASRLIVEGRASVLHLAPRFTTTVRLPEPVSSVIVGDQNLFHAEHSPNEPLLVFVKPATPAVAETNLLITTAGGRQFPLLFKSDGEAGRPDSPLDLLVICRTGGTSLIEETYPTSLIGETVALESTRPNDDKEKAPSIGGAALTQLIERQRNRPLPRLQGQRLQVGIGQVIERNSQFVVLFSVMNSTGEPVELMPPQIQLAGQTKSGLLKHSSRWTTVEQIPVMDFRLDQRKLDPGARADGLVVFERPALKQSNETLLLQIAEAAMVDQPVLAPISFSVSGKPEGKHE